jgi:MarR family transcriptional regulator, organic hydroperoxide resistance regulator
MNDSWRSRDLAHLLSTLERHVVERQRVALGVEGCGVEEWRVIDFLAEDGHTMSEAAKYAGLASPALTKLVDRLVTNNIVYRRIDLQDRRKVRIFLTRRGKSMHRRLAEIVDQCQAELLAETADGELIEELLQRLSTPTVLRGIVSTN